MYNDNKYFYYNESVYSVIQDNSILPDVSLYKRSYNDNKMFYCHTCFETMYNDNIYLSLYMRVYNDNKYFSYT